MSSLVYTLLYVAGVLIIIGGICYICITIYNCIKRDLDDYRRQKELKAPSENPHVIEMERRQEIARQIINNGYNEDNNDNYNKI